MTIRDIFHQLNELDDEELINLCVDTFAQNLIRTRQLPCASWGTVHQAPHGDA